MKSAVISGVTGQDGYFLSKLLLSYGYNVIGIKRRTSLPTDGRLTKLLKSSKFELVDGDVTDLASIEQIIEEHKPDEFYHLAAMSHVQRSWDYPIATSQITGLGTLNCLEAVRKHRKQCRFYFAGSSEQFGNIGDGSFKLDENTSFSPESPYAAAKVFGYNIAHVYRKSYKMFISCGILTNHESELRGYEFVTRHITSSLAKIKHGLETYVTLGNMDARRDWGHAEDFCYAMYLLLQQDQPLDVVVATGESHSVREFFEKACEWFELDSHKILRIDQKLMRPNDVKVLIGNANLAKKKLGWTPKISFDELINRMCQHDFYEFSPDPVIRKLTETLI